MAEYIEKAALMRHIEEQAHEWGEDYDAQQILGDIEDFPVESTCPYFVHNENDRGNDSLCGKAGCEVEAVRPVVHGRWIENDETGEIYCSECGRTTNDRHDETQEFDGKKVIALCYPRYCGFCGADMRG